MRLYAFKLLVIFLAIFSFEASANETQLYLSGDLWGIPLFTGPEGEPGKREAIVGLGKAIGLSYLVGDKNGLIFGAGYRDNQYGYVQIRNTSFSALDKYWFGKIGYWKNTTSNRGSIVWQVHYTFEYGSGSIHLNGGHDTPKDTSVQYISLNGKVINYTSVRVADAQMFWFGEIGLFKKFYDFTYSGTNFNAGNTSGTGRYLIFSVGLGMGW